MLLGDIKEFCLEIAGVELAVLFPDELILAGREFLLPLPGRVLPDDGFAPIGGVGTNGRCGELSFPSKFFEFLRTEFAAGADIFLMIVYKKTTTTHLLASLIGGHNLTH